MHMRNKTLIIVVLSLLMSACTTLPNLNWRAASKSLNQTSKDLVMIKMAEEGLFPYWMNPYSMNWMDFVMWDQILHERQAEMESSLFRYENLLRERLDTDYDELVNTIVSLLLESGLYPCPELFPREEEKKEKLKPNFFSFSDLFRICRFALK